MVDSADTKQAAIDGQPSGAESSGGAGEKKRSRRLLFTPTESIQQEERSQSLLLLTTRLTYLVLLVTVTLLPFVGQITEKASSIEEFAGLWPTIAALVAFGVIVLVLDSVTPNKRLATVVGVFLGIVAGLTASLALGILVDLVAESWDIAGEYGGAYVQLIKTAIAITLCYLAVSIVLTTKDDFRLVIPYVEFARQVRGVRPLLLDTSALIDGRIDNLGSTGFLDAPLIVPQFVIDELHQLADSGDKLKRARGRLGLSVLSKLQDNPAVDITIDPGQAGGLNVDHALVRIAAEQNLRILTTDYNLNKVAKIQGVDVLNINDLANTLKAQVIPGESLRVDLVKPGESPDQGVGYMPDGTMVVVEDGAPHIGSSVQIVVTNSLQTSAGRMIFGKLSATPAPSPSTGDGSTRTDHHGASHASSGEDGGRLPDLARAATEQPRASGKPPRRAEGNPRRNPRR